MSKIQNQLKPMQQPASTPAEMRRPWAHFSANAILVRGGPAWNTSNSFPIFVPTRDPSLVREAPDSLGGNRPGQVQNHFCSERHLHIVYHVCFSKGKSKISFTYAKNVLQQIILGPTLQLICMVWGVTIRCWRGRRSERAEIRICSCEKKQICSLSLAARPTSRSRRQGRWS